MPRRWPLILVLAATMLTFVSTVGYQFIFDDLGQILQNPRVQAWHYVPSYFTTHVWAQDPEVIHKYYRPLFLLQLRLMHAVFGFWTPGWHLVMLLLHLGTVLLVYQLVRCWKDAGTATMAAALFALHPVHAEVVSWVSACGEPVMVMALLGSLILALRPGRRDLVIATALYALALLLKETAVVWPVAIFLIVYDGPARTIRRTLPFWVVTVFYLLVRRAALGHAVATPYNHQPLALLPAALAKYFLHLVWPVGLSEFYFLQPNWAWLALLLPLLVGLLWAARRGQYERAAVVILLLPLAPVLNLRLMSAEFLLQDRYLYLPSVGFVMLLAPLFLRVPKPAVAALLLLMAIGCGRESRVWSDHEHLFRRALELSPTDLRARDGLARAYARKGNYSEAIVILEPLVQEAQPSARRLQQSLMTLAYSHERLGHLQQAFQYYSAADQLYPNPEIERHLAELKSALDSQPSRWVPQ
jgi:tetratricopeptide (TPR) repeat protein